MNSLTKVQLEGIKCGKVFNFQAGNHNPILPAQIGTHPNLSPGQSPLEGGSSARYDDYAS
ncbi:MAG: hypothetical protein H7095_08465 [Pseudopedobacter sp.]|nr:hypothetical protein [Deinococcales bacterium]